MAARGDDRTTRPVGDGGGGEAARDAAGDEHPAWRPRRAVDGDGDPVRTGVRAERLHADADAGGARSGAGTGEGDVVGVERVAA